MKNPFYPVKDLKLIRNGQVVFRGALLLTDISGFTALTELLTESGKHGTEQLTALLNSYFDKMLTIADKYQGTVITFSGDSILVRFTEEKKALACAEMMLEAMNAFSDITVLNNKFSLKAKVVVGNGQWNQYIVGDNNRAHLLLSGALIRELARREEVASAGDLILFHSTATVSSASLPSFALSNDAFLSPGSNRLYGEHRSVTAVFLNVYTDDADYRVIENFQKLYLNIAATVRRFGGYLHHIDDMLSNGSRIFILFGAPVAQDNDTLNAILAATDIFSDKQDRPGFSLSCGIDTGYVFSGMVGNESRRQYTVIGDCVNTASRLADKAELGTITVSESVYNRTLSHLEFEELSGIIVKGKNKPLKRFKPLGRFPAVHNSIPFAGRKQELAEIARIIQHSGVILLSGNAGIGKTTFLNKLSDVLSGKGFSIIRSERTKHGPASEILITMAGSICGITSDMDKTETAEQLHNYMIEANNGQLTSREVYIARMLFGLEFPHDTYDTLPPRLKRENLLEAITLLISELPEPLCVIIEDIHYSNAEEMELLQEVINTVMQNSEQQLCFLLSTRPSEQCFFKDDSGISLFHLEGLDRQQSFELLSGIAGEKSVEKEILQVLTDRSQGNPFFLVQFFLYLKENHLILHSDNSWVRAGESSLESLPESIFSMIMARIDTLTEGTRESLKVASVVGVQFDKSIIQSIIQRNVHLDLLESSQAGLTFALQFSELEHIFSHMLIRDVAYDSILRKRRKLVHKDIGLILEKTHSGRKDLDRILAYHFENAEEWEKAVKYSISAGKLAAEEFRNREALNHYSNGIRIIKEYIPDQKESLAECTFLSGSVRELIGEYPEAIRCYEKVSEISSDLSLTGNAILELADILFTQGKLEEGMTTIDNLSERLSKTTSKDKTQELRIAAFRAWTCCVTGDIDTAMQMALLAVEIGESLSGVSEFEKAKRMGHALNTLATVHWVKAEYSLAKKLYERAIEIALRNGMKREAAITYGNIGLVLEKQGKYSEASRVMEKQLKMAVEIGDKLLILSAHGELCTNNAELGNYERAIHHGRKQMKLAESLSALHDTLLSYNHLAAIYSAMGQSELGVKYAEKAFELSENSSFEREKAYSLSLLGKLKLDSGELSSAMNLLRKAEKLAENVHSYTLLQDIYLKIALVMISLGNLDQSEEVISKVHNLLEKTEMKKGTADYVCTLGELHAARGRMDKAFQSFNEGISILRELDAKPALAEAYKSFALLLKKGDSEYLSEADQYMKMAADLYSDMKLPDEAGKCVLT